MSSPLRLLSSSLRPIASPFSTTVPAHRHFSTTPSNHFSKALLFLEHRDNKLNPASFNALTAATKIVQSDPEGGQVDGVILVGEKGAKESEGAVKEAGNLPLSTLHIHHSPTFTHFLPEPIAPSLASLVKNGEYTHLVAAHTANGRNIFPRVAAKLDVAQISDISSVISPTQFTRPIYAGNAIAKVESSDKIKIVTVRSSTFEAAKAEEGGKGKAEVKEEEAKDVGEALTTWQSEYLTPSGSRPELGSASRIVSGGRGLKNKENFDSLIIPLADSLKAAIGASRAAVDSGYADNSLQVGQTGKVVAPEVYLAVGISGAIQHLAGMKDSKVIVAINKDAEAPIFQVADHGLVADLFKAVPELTEKLNEAGK